MRSFFTTSLRFIGLWVLIFACTATEKLQVIDQNFSDEIALQQNLTFTFDRAIAVPEQLDKWQDIEYLEINPPVKGKFKWTTPSTLVFSPEMGFAPNTKYQAKLTQNLLADLTKQNIAIDNEKVFDFHTPYLDIARAQAFWSADKSGSPVLNLGLRFNYPVEPNNLKNKLALTIDDKAAAFTLETDNVGDEVKLVVKSSENAAGKRIYIEIKEGLSIPQGNGTAPIIKHKTEIPSYSVFNISQVNSYKLGGQTIVRVLTNQSVSQNEAQIKDLVSISPKVSVEVEKIDAGFLLKGEFKNNTNYKLIIKDELKGIFDSRLKKDYEHVLLFGKVQKSLSFVDKKAVYLTTKGEKNIGLNLHGYSKVELEVYKIYENNLQHFLREAIGLYDYDEVRDYFYQMKDYGDLVVKKEMKITDFKRAGGIYAIDMQEMMREDKNPFEGIYYLIVRSTEDRWSNIRQIVCVSDMGFVVRQSEDELLVFTNSIMSASPIADAKVNLVSTSNQTIQTAQTDANGVAKFTGLKELSEKYNFQLLTAQKDDDFSYIHFNQNAISKYGFETGGIRPTKGDYQTYIYPERNLYRPNEKISFKTIVRHWDEWKSVGSIPVKWKVLFPNGKTLVEKKNSLSKEGTFAATIPLPENTVTGSYTIQVFNSNDVLLASRNINVEEFIPQRIKVESSVNREVVANGERITHSATATNLFGPPAADRNYQVTLSYDRKSFSPPSDDKKYRDYNFYLNVDYDRMPKLEPYEATGETSQEGKLSNEVVIPEGFENIGVMKGTFYTTVFDETGRPVNSRSTFDVKTQPYFLGIKGLDYYWTGINQTYSFPLVAMTYEGKVIPADARVQVVRKEWQTVLEKYNNRGDYRYVSRYKEITEYDKKVRVNTSGTSISYSPEISGQYEVRVFLPNADTYVKTRFYAYRWGSASNTSFQVDKEGKIDITLDKPKYNTGETAKVLFKAPFSGKMLVTIERDKVIDYKYIDVKNRSASMDIPLSDAYLPNVYVSATLLRPLSNTDVPLTVAHGYQPINIENTDKHKIELQITAVEKSRSKTTQTIKVKTDRPMEDVEVTIAAVDEGILLLKNFQTPDPYNFFFQKRALRVSAFDVYERLYPEFRARIQNFGAGGYDLANRTNPMANKRVKPVSFWSGTLKTDANGEVSYTIDVPQFSGDLRIMAVAVKGDAFGSAQKSMKVADPIVISAGIPRFLSPKDKIDMPVTVTNTTDKTAKATVKLNLKGALSASGDMTQTVSIAPNSEARINFDINAIEAVGTGKIDVSVNAMNETFVHTTDITVRPATSLLKESGAGSVGSNQNKSIDFSHQYVPTSADAKLIISKSPMVQFTKSLDYLVRYPYGCVEQTTSSVFPQLYVRDLADSFGEGLDYDLKPENNIRIAINKLQSMQLYKGGFAYWQGGHEASWWGSVYATHFLLEAKKAGCQVRQDVLDKSYEYLLKRVKGKPTERLYYYNVNGERTSRPIAKKDIFYSLYVLASVGKQDVATMNYYKANKHLLAIDSRYLLASTYKMLGDERSYANLLPPSFSGEKSIQSLGDNFYSYTRDLAISLNTIIDQDPKNAQIGTLAKQLSEQYRQRRWHNTQEHAFTFLALGKIARKANQSNITASISAGGQKLADYDNKTLSLSGKQIIGKEVVIDTNGEGNLYYFWEKEGISLKGEYIEEDKNLKVRRTFLDKRGNPISGKVKQNQMVVVRIEVISTSIDEIENVVITDMLPAGLEIENPRLGGAQQFDWMKNASYPEHFDFRDDRVNIFTDVRRKKPQYYYYQTRAVTPGTYQVGVVSADAMYDASYHSYHGAGTLVVE